eukprot:m.6591 g.6591  ORF g.6591 m.6591 type:complete len:414 (-) comp5176_c0_seq1:1366-2607(-)
MLQSVYLLNQKGDVLLEKHNRNPLSRSVLDPLQDALLEYEDMASVPPVIAGGRFYVIHIQRDNIILATVCQKECPPMFVLELLSSIYTMFVQYFETVTEKSIQKNAVLICQILEEMIDNGFPLTIEPNVLEAMIMKPTIFNSVMKGVGRKKGFEDKLPTGQLTTTHWRRAGVKYSNNECFIDVEETINAIISKSGTPVVATVQGEMVCRCRLSGMPDCTLVLENPRSIDEISFHPCVRILRWQSEQVLSFIPPDGLCTLASYVVRNVQNVPIQARSFINFKQVGGGKIEIDLSSRLGVSVDQLEVSCTFPKSVNSVMATVSNGPWSYEEMTKTLKWTPGKLSTSGPTTLRGTVSLAVGATPPEGAPPLMLKFRVNGTTASGLKARRLDVLGESYKPFKGIKYVTRAGDFEVRA